MRSNPDLVDRLVTGSDANLQWQVRRAFEASCKFIKLEFEVHDDGTPFFWEIAHPTDLLSAMLHDCPNLAQLYASAMEKFPPHIHTWRIVIGWDEFTPGNKLTNDNSRKVMVLSFNFLELGIEALQSAATWITPAVVRNQVISSVVGGWSHMLSRFLHCLLLGSKGFAEGGVSLSIQSRDTVLFAKLAALMSDGEGLQVGLDWKGAGSFKPCLRHSNVVKKDADFTTGAFVDITCHTFANLQAYTAKGLEDAADLVRSAHERWQRGAMTNSMYEKIEQANGLSYNPRGLLWDMTLRPHVPVADIITMDWVHSALQDGSLAVEMFSFIDACASKIDTQWAELESYVYERWEFPHMLNHRGRGLHRIFSDWRTSESSSKVRATAGELLGVYPLVRHWAHESAQHESLRLELASFYAACDVVDAIMMAKCSASPSRVRAIAANLKALVGRHMQAHKAAYGTERLKPKHEWLFDVCVQLERDGLVLDAFIIEHKHLSVKACAQHCKNLSAFERTVLRGSILEQRRELQRLANNTLVGQAAVPCPGFPGAEMSKCLVTRGITIRVDDIVLSSARAPGLVIACAREADALLLVVQCMERAKGLHMWKQTGLTQVWPASDVQVAAAWRHEDNGCLTVLRRC